jgi:hypothetical protein
MVHVRDALRPTLIPWGQQATGAQIAANESAILGDASPAPAVTMRIGLPWTWQPAMGQVAIIGLPAINPVLIRSPDMRLFLDPATMFAVPATALSFQLPNDTRLVGSVLGVQVLITYFGGFLTGPAWILVAM